MTKTEKWYDTPEVDALLEEAAQDTSPLVTISTPEDLEALRQRLGLTSKTKP